MNIGTPELLFILAVALVVFGPQRIPDLMRQAARTWRQVRHFSDEMQREFRSAVRELELEDEEELKRHPPGYDPVTHSVPYQPPDIPHMYVPPDKRGAIVPLPEEAAADPSQGDEAVTSPDAIVTEEVR